MQDLAWLGLAWLGLAWLARKNCETLDYQGIPKQEICSVNGPISKKIII